MDLEFIIAGLALLAAVIRLVTAVINSKKK